MIKRLKLYDTNLDICIDKKTKDKLRKLAFKNKMTMSEFVRNLIKLIVLSNEKDIVNLKGELTDLDINKLMVILGGIKNK